MKKSEIRYVCMTAFSILCLLLIQRFVCALSYTPVMDDWFLYGDMCDDIWTQFIIPNQKFSIRPLAGLIDIFIVGPMFGSLWVIKLFICAMLVSSALMLCRVLYKDGFASGGFIILMICLFPLNLEATYWLAAAVRSVSALFFVSLSAFLIMKYGECKKVRYIVFYVLTGLAAVGFCEQVIPLYLLLCVYLLIKYADKRTVIIPFVHTAVIALYYIFNRHCEVISDRGQFLTHEAARHTAVITSALFRIVGQINVKMIVSGFMRGISVLINDYGLPLLIVSAVCVFFAVCASRGYSGKTFRLRKAVFGFIMSLCGILVFYIIEDTRFSVRSVFFFTVGIGVFFDELLSLIPQKVRSAVCVAFISCAAFVFTVSGIGTVSQYNEVSKRDTQIVRNMISADYDNDLMSSDKFAYLLDTFTYYPDVDSAEYFESIRAACSGIADLSGCLMHELHTRNANHIVPVENGAEIQSVGDGANFEANLLSGSCRFFALMPDYSVINVYAVPDEDNSFSFTAEGGEVYGHIYQRDGAYVFEKNEIQ